MKNLKYIIFLFLTACPGSGSKPAVSEPSLKGKWVSEDFTLDLGDVEVGQQQTYTFPYPESTDRCSCDLLIAGNGLRGNYFVEGCNGVKACTDLNQIGVYSLEGGTLWVKSDKFEATFGRP